MNCLTRRDFISHLIHSGFSLGSFNSLAGKIIISSDNKKATRRYHICLQPRAIKEFPELPTLIKEAGVTDLWLAGFFYGHWYQKPDELVNQAEKLKRLGFRIHTINLPLGHPGTSIGVSASHPLNTPPSHWRNACSTDGKLYSGTSIHPPAIEENVKALESMHAKGFKSIFLDDDFRLARSPGQIGGCFCKECRDHFIKSYGFNLSDWELLIESVVERNPSYILRQWVDHSCNKLFDMFVRMERVAADISLGIMVMYLGSEKAGIPLDRFRHNPFRVGELMFDDKSFGRIKGKTDELFSSLFHRRFAHPDLAYSESTAYPADKLSARNMAAKLSISLISDVRCTMFMSGMNPFPVTHWSTLGPAMKKSARLHEKVAGHTQRGPLKHYWGWESRLVGKDKPFSLFLALGIPFEVVDELPADGWVFLSNEDANAITEGRLAPVAANLIARPEQGRKTDKIRYIHEDLEHLFKFKKSLNEKLRGIPHIVEDVPAVFSWYPTAEAALVWNLTEERKDISVQCDGRVLRRLSVDALGIEIISGLQV
jgi:hypothetical protein